MTQNDQPVRPALRLLLRTPIFLRPVNVSLSGESCFTDGNCFAAGGGATHPALMVQTKCVVPPVTPAHKLRDGDDVFNAVVFEHMGHPRPPVLGNRTLAQNDNPALQGNQITPAHCDGAACLVAPGCSVRPVKVRLYYGRRTIHFSNHQKQIAIVAVRANEVVPDVIGLRKHAVRFPFGSAISACPHGDLLMVDVLVQTAEKGLSRRRERTQLRQKNLLVDVGLCFETCPVHSGLLRRVRLVRNVAHWAIVKLIHPLPAVMNVTGFRSVLPALVLEKPHRAPDILINRSIVDLILESGNAHGVRRNLCLGYFGFGKGGCPVQHLVKILGTRASEQLVVSPIDWDIPLPLAASQLVNVDANVLPEVVKLFHIRHLPFLHGAVPTCSDPQTRAVRARRNRCIPGHKHVPHLYIRQPSRTYDPLSIDNFQKIHRRASPQRFPQQNQLSPPFWRDRLYAALPKHKYSTLCNDRRRSTLPAPHFYLTDILP